MKTYIQNKALLLERTEHGGGKTDRTYAEANIWKCSWQGDNYGHVKNFMESPFSLREPYGFNQNLSNYFSSNRTNTVLTA
jgi:hypothetical protein